MADQLLCLPLEEINVGEQQIPFPLSYQAGAGDWKDPSSGLFHVFLVFLVSQDAGIIPSPSYRAGSNNDHDILFCVWVSLPFIFLAGAWGGEGVVSFYCNQNLEVCWLRCPLVAVYVYDYFSGFYRPNNFQNQSRYWHGYQLYILSHKVIRISHIQLSSFNVRLNASKLLFL